MTEGGQLWLVALAAASGFGAVGLRVARSAHSLERLDALAAPLFGRAAPLAVLLTRSGYAGFLTLASALFAGIWIALGRSPLLPLGLVLTQLASQALVAALKEHYRRERPSDWMYRREAGTSFPSGHATTAVVFYGAVLVVVALGPLPAVAKVPALALLAAWGVGICWSRIALGAHFPSDVLGGALLGAAFLFSEVALARHFHVM